MAESLILSDAWRERLERPLSEKGLARLWDEASPLPGGRGTARLARILDSTFVLKREARGGLSRRFLPDRYARRTPFQREWADANLAAGAGLCPRPAARSYVHSGPFFAVYTLTEEVTGGRSLTDLLDGEAPPPWKAAGEALARLHRLGLVHGDLNAGNLLLPAGGKVRFLDLRHSEAFDGPPPLAGRRRNLTRLARSLHKLHHTRGLAWPSAPWERLASGYAEGWGEREEWLGEWMEEAAQGFRLRALLWRPS